MTFSFLWMVPTRMSWHPEPSCGLECLPVIALTSVGIAVWRSWQVPRSYSSRPVFEKVVWRCLVLLIGKTRLRQPCLMYAGKSDVFVGSSDYESNCGVRWFIRYLRDPRVAGYQNTLPNVSFCIPNNIVERPNHFYRISSHVFLFRTSYPLFITAYVKWRICNWRNQQDARTNIMLLLL